MNGVMLNTTSNMYRQDVSTKMTDLAGLIIAVLPILAPYKLCGIYVNWILGVLFLGLHFAKQLKVLIPRYSDDLIIYTLVTALISVNGFFTLNNITNLVNAQIGLFLELFIYMTLWSYANVEKTMKYANFFGYICCGYTLFQVFMQMAGNTVPLGQIPFLEVSTGWIPEVWGFRFNSLFSEPSYFAIYLLPIFAYNYLNNHWIKCAIFALFIVLSSSSLGIITMICVILYSLVDLKVGQKQRLKYIKIIFVAIFAGIILMVLMPQLGIFVYRSVNKIIEAFTVEAGDVDSIRLGGHIQYFGVLPLKEQLLGVGNAQLQNYFWERGIDISNYSNSFVLSILNFGVIGFATFIGFLIKLLRWSINKRTVVFFLILLLAFAVDSLLFSYRYYWLVFFVLYAHEREEK